MNDALSTPITYVMGVATSDAARRLYNAVISTGTEARDITAGRCLAEYGYGPKTRDLVHTLENLSLPPIADWRVQVSAARCAVRTFINRCTPIY